MTVARHPKAKDQLMARFETTHVIRFLGKETTPPKDVQSWIGLQISCSLSLGGPIIVVLSSYVGGSPNLVLPVASAWAHESRGRLSCCFRAQVNVESVRYRKARQKEVFATTR